MLEFINARLEILPTLSQLFLIIFLVFLPFYVFHKYSSREEDKKYEEEHPEILKSMVPITLVIVFFCIYTVSYSLIIAL